MRHFLSNKRIMKTDDSIFDHEALEKRKIASIIARGRKNKQQNGAKDKEDTKPLPWHRKELSAKDFRVVFDEKNDAFYIRHIAWKPTIYMGPYPTTKDANKAIKDYVAETKKPFLERNVGEGVHSYVAEKPIENPKEKK